MDDFVKSVAQKGKVSSAEGLTLDVQARDVNFLNHYVLYSKELESVVRDEFWRSVSAINMSMRSLVYNSTDKMFLDNLDQYAVYKVGIMNRTTMQYIPMEEPEVVFGDLSFLALSKGKKEVER